MSLHVSAALFWCLYLSSLEKPSASSERVFLPVCPAHFTGLSLKDVGGALSLRVPAPVPGIEDHLRARDWKNERMDGTQLSQ